jgi:hypothetical protein
MRIEIVEIKNRGVYDVFLGDDLLCQKTRTPLCSAARELSARGYPSDTVLEKVRRGSNKVDMRSTIGNASKLTVTETGFGPKFRTFKVGDADANQPSQLEGARDCVSSPAHALK